MLTSSCSWKDFERHP